MAWCQKLRQIDIICGRWGDTLHFQTVRESAAIKWKAVFLKIIPSYFQVEKEFRRSSVHSSK